MTYNKSVRQELKHLDDKLLCIGEILLDCNDCVTNLRMALTKAFREGRVEREHEPQSPENVYDEEELPF